MQIRLDVETPHGPGCWVVDAADDPRALLALGHGAGGGIDAPDLAALAEGLPRAGITVARYEQPWLVAGRKVAGRPSTLDAGWLPALDALGAEFPGVPRLDGGRSAGARVACRCFAAPARGVVALSFPLHPPGKPDRSRIAELAAVSGPVLLLQGDADPFGTPDELRAAIRGEAQRGTRELVAFEGVAHSFAARSKAARAAAAATAGRLVDAVTAFVRSSLE